MRKIATIGESYKGFDINANTDKGQLCICPILDRYDAHIFDMINRHSKVMQVRFDLRYPQDGSIVPMKEQLSSFNYNFTRHLNRKQYAGGHLVDPRLILAPEQHHSRHPHIHGILLVNANAQNKYYPLLLDIEHFWGMALSTAALGLVDHCDTLGKNGIIIARSGLDYDDAVRACYYQASYIAKLRGKENLPKGTWLVSGTRRPKG